VRLGHDKPSHILVPAIHRNRAEIRNIFLAEMDGVSVRHSIGRSDRALNC
jgi:L-lactate utilization protein LutB